MRISYFRNVTRSGYSAVVKEAMAMRDGHLLKRAGREFAKNLTWMALDYVFSFTTSSECTGCTPA